MSNHKFTLRFSPETVANLRRIRAGVERRKSEDKKNLDRALNHLSRCLLVPGDPQSERVAEFLTEMGREPLFFGLPWEKTPYAARRKRVRDGK